MKKDEREDELRQLFRNKRLIGELPLTSNEINRLKNEKEVHHMDIWNIYPYLAAFITVGIGNLYYAGGNLWGAFEWLHNVNEQNRWGGKFEEFVKIHDSLETFKVLKEKGHHRYVAPILAHGGIPKYCLDDFFELVTKYSDPQSSGVEFIAELQKNRNWLANTASPVPIKNFLLQGGEVAEAFVSRFLALWGSREREDGGGNHGLPERVVRQFGEWLKKNRPIKRKHRKHFPIPGIYISPGDMWVYLLLPRCDNYEEVHPGAIWNYSGKKKAVTREHRIPLPIKERWTVRFQNGNEFIQFDLDGLTNILPVMFFNPVSGKLIVDPENRRLPEHLWAIYREDENVKPEPLSFDNLDHWSGYRAGLFDLSKERYINIGTHQFEVKRPFFNATDIEYIKGVMSENGLPVLNTPPQISWEEKANFSLKRNKVDEGNIDIPSEDFKMLFDLPGEYEFTLRGALGQIIRQHFVLIPGLNVNLNPQVIWPDKKIVEIDIRTQDKCIFSGDTYKNPFHFNIIQNALTLKIQIPRLEWKLSLSKTENEREGWHATPDEVEFNLLEQVDYPRLVIRISGERHDLDIHLLGKNGRIEPPKSRRISIVTDGIWSFDLRQVQDSVLSSGRSEEFKVMVTEKGEKLYQGKILLVRPQWDLQKIGAEWKKATGVSITVTNRSANVDGRWLIIFPLFRPWSKEIIKHRLETGKNIWSPKVDRPGRYLVRAIHAPWGEVDWYEADFLKEKYFDVKKVNWPMLYGSNSSLDSIEKYTECLLAHFCHPQIVPNLPKSPESLVSDDIVRFLIYLNKFDDLSGRTKPYNLLNIFYMNPHATSDAVLEYGEIQESWKKFLPSIEFIELTPKKNDIKFIKEIVLNYDVIQMAAQKIQRDNRKSSLSTALVKWHELLCKNDSHFLFQVFAEVIFLCRKFEIDRKMSPILKEQYKKLETRINNGEDQ